MKVSIISLIYQSGRLADWVHDSVQRFTPLIERGQAEFFFVANDPTPALVRHLGARGYAHIVNHNVMYTDDELFRLGYGRPEYISRVYRGYNLGVEQARGDLVVLLNSDNFLSPDWLENLLKYADRSSVISSKLVERHHPVLGVFPGANHAEFGSTADTFDEPAFLAYAARIRKTGLERGGAYMPSLIHRDVALEAGLYPCGNIAGGSFDEIVRYGDEAFFDRLASIGVTHYTALDSISYHLKEGELADATAEAEPAVGAEQPSVRTFTTAATSTWVQPSVERVRDSMAPTKVHRSFIERLTIPGDDAPRETFRQLLASSVLDVHQREQVEIALALLDEASADAARRAARAARHNRRRRAVARFVGTRRADAALRLMRLLAQPVRTVRRSLRRLRRRLDGELVSPA